MLGRLKTIWKMNEAALVVENLLREHTGSGLFHLDPKQCATRWVAYALHHHEQMLGGRFGQRPHKISVAAFALSYGASDLVPGGDAMFVAWAALGTALKEVAVNGSLYPFNGIDRALIEQANDVFWIRSAVYDPPENEEAAALSSQPAPVVPMARHAGAGPTNPKIAELDQRIAALRSRSGSRP